MKVKNLFLTFTFVLAAPAFLIAQASIVVMNTDATGPGSLNQSILDIDNGGLITFDSSLAGQEVELNEMTADIQNDFIIDGEAQNISIKGYRDDFSTPLPVIEIDGGRVDMRNLDINMADIFLAGSSGTIVIEGNGKLTFSNVDLECESGCMFINLGEVEMTDSDANIQYRAAGFEVRNGSKLSLLRSSITSPINGGVIPGGKAVTVFQGDAIFRDSNLSAVRHMAGNLEIYDSNFYNTDFTWSGAALEIGANTTFDIHRSTFSAEGGGISSRGSGGIYSSMITQFQPYDGFLYSSLICFGGSLQLANSTVLGYANIGDELLNGIRISSSCNLEIYSSLVVGDPAVFDVFEGNVGQDYLGDFNFISDPSFETWSDPLLDRIGDPSFQSPIIDQGDCALYSQSTDLSGDPRPWDAPITNAQGGDGCDIGSTERQDLNPSGFHVESKLILSGAWNGNDMTTALQAQGLIPLAQPYEDVPDVSVEPSFLAAHPEIVDWIWIRPRAGTDSNSADWYNKRAVFLTKDGSILSPDGATGFYFHDLYDGPSSFYHLIVGHRNHLSTMSAIGLNLIEGSTAIHDFTSGITQAYSIGGLAMKDLGTGIFGLWGGDGNASGDVTALDFLNIWLPVNGGPALYQAADFNLDGVPTVLDFLNIWLSANGQASQLPQ